MMSGDHVSLIPYSHIERVCVEWETETVTIHIDPSEYDEDDCWYDGEYSPECDEAPYDWTVTRQTGNCLRWEDHRFIGSLRLPDSAH